MGWLTERLSAIEKGVAQRLRVNKGGGRSTARKWQPDVNAKQAAQPN